jgi:hypothetical protein
VVAKTRALVPPASSTLLSAAQFASVIAVMAAVIEVEQIEQIEQIADGGHVARDVFIVVIPLYGIGQIVAAALLSVPLSIQFRSMNFTNEECSLYTWLTWPPVEKGDTAIIGMRGPVPKKSTGWMKPESYMPPPSSTVTKMAVSAHFRVALRGFHDVLREGFEQAPFR